MSMKLGTQTGSLTNHIYSRQVRGQPEPEVGMGATVLCWTDRHGATITAVDGNVITVREDQAVRTDKNGMSEMQEWAHTPDPQGREHYFRRDKHGFWRQVRWNPYTSRWNKVDGYGLKIGVRQTYWDPSF